jgi:hypothetical protein
VLQGDGSSGFTSPLPASRVPTCDNLRIVLTANVARIADKELRRQVEQLVANHFQTGDLRG